VTDSEVGPGLHQLVMMHGRERAREMVSEKQRSLVDIAAEVMADEAQRIGISYTGFCLTSLPTSVSPRTKPGRRRDIRSRFGSSQAG
jgi:hypothetical protein